jgi:hypothetical protein
LPRCYDFPIFRRDSNPYHLLFKRSDDHWARKKNLELLFPRKFNPSYVYTFQLRQDSLSSAVEMHRLAVISLSSPTAKFVSFHLGIQVIERRFLVNLVDDCGGPEEQDGVHLAVQIDSDLASILCVNFIICVKLIICVSLGRNQSLIHIKFKY